MPSLGKRVGRLGAERARRVRLVLAEEQAGLRLGVQVEHAEFLVLGPGDRVRGCGPRDAGLGSAVFPGPRVAEPQGGQHVQRGVLVGAIVHGDAAQDVFRPVLRVLHLDIEITPLLEDTRIEELVFHVVPGPGPVHRRQIGVGEFGLRVLVEVALIAVRRQVIDVEVVLLDVLTMVALGVGQAEQAFLQDRVPLVPQRESQAQPLLVVADPGDAILTPPVRAGPGLVVAEVGPGVSVVAVILPDRAPLPFAEIRSPRSPRQRPSGLPGVAVPRPSARLGWGRAARWADPQARCPCPFWALVFVKSGLWSPRIVFGLRQKAMTLLMPVGLPRIRSGACSGG